MTPAGTALSLTDLADGGGLLALDDTGAPVGPLAVLDLTGGGALAPEVLARALAAATASNRVLVGRTDLPLDPRLAPLAAALSCTLTSSAADLDRTCVHVPDVELALDAITALTGRSPLAAVSLVGLLRLTHQVPVADGLVAESFAYSMLLAGPEFARWRSARPRREVLAVRTEPVHLDRRDDALTITLNRPERHNAYGRAVRDALVEALAVAVHDRTVTTVHLRGAGPSFCSGGDLEEFGTAPDVVAAHVIRQERSAAALLHLLADRTVAHLHGTCIGAGLELPAFARTVVAHPGSGFQLPELAMGLVPGAGGSVSVPARIGRWRTAYLVLSGARVDAATALRWGLVDRLAD